ncbi:MAG: SUMF1/EgtB/PvdO family nonheme iron enzyme [Planctomycetes bacterium]|nr:SUMF1/EgtB/PvdO family nonheme iron enzyme [Planctomycetota bacterium]
MKNRAWTGLGSVALCGVLLAITPRTTGQTLPNYGYEWATITHPGNRNANALEAPRFHPPFRSVPIKVGRVDYEYRIAKTQVTVGQWFEFVNAYFPHMTDPRYTRLSGALTGNWIWATNRNPSQPPAFIMEPGSDKYATDMSWRFAARYVNWLHNDKINEKWAFENGVYDTATFTDNPDGSFNDQQEHSPGAKFWIPTMNEWIKANHFDPDRYGPGEAGYWPYNSTSDIELIGGPPGSPGAQTDNGGWGDPFTHYPVDSYPDTLSPWGLLAASGGTLEWTEAIAYGRGLPKDRFLLGSFRWGALEWDRLDTFRISHPSYFPFMGLRLSSVVPPPATFVGLGAASLFFVLQRRRK